MTGLNGTYGHVARPAGRSLAQLTVSGVIGADLADTVLATSIASGPIHVTRPRLPPSACPIRRSAGQLPEGGSKSIGLGAWCL